MPAICTACVRLLALAALVAAPAAAATVTIATKQGTTTEGSENIATVVVRIDQAPSEQLVVWYTISGTATAADYTGPTGYVVIEPGQKFAIVTVQGLVDAVTESAETVIVTLDATSNPKALLGTAKAATVTINNAGSSTSGSSGGWDLSTAKSG